jgi:hypothetical protein
MSRFPVVTHSPEYRLRIAVSVFLVLLGVPAYAQTPNTVEGTVRTVDGRPVPGATIRIAGATGAGRGTSIKATTGANGRYSVKVPLGHYDVDAFADIEFDGQTYKEILLDRGDATCERVMSTKGIVRNFTLRVSGQKRCLAGHDRTNPNSWNGGYITAVASDIADSDAVTFKLTPLGPLADGTAGRALSFTRTGAALQTGSGPIGSSRFLHDIPLGRYRVAAEIRRANGDLEQATLELNDGGGTSGSTLEITFHANVFGGGIRPVGISVSPGGTASAEPAPPADAPVTDAPATDAPPTPEAEAPVIPADPPAEVQNEAPPAPVPPSPPAAELPRGRYACSYRSPYAGDIPTGKSITISAGGRYQAYGRAGTYTLDPATSAVQWTGPLGEGDVQATFEKRNGLPAITVVGGGASDDPERTNFCVLIGAR